MKYLPIDNNLFIENRQRFAKIMKPNTIAIFVSNDEMPRNGDQNFPFRQSSDFFYMTGIDQPKSILILYPDCARKEFREVLFTEETSDLIAIWYGKKYSKQEATVTSGIERAEWLDAFPGVLVDVMANCDGVYLNTNENIRYDSPVQYAEMRFIGEMKAKYPLHQYYRSAPIMKNLRTIKSKIEVDLMQEACNITEAGFRRLLGFIKPGVMEYEIEAEIMHEFLSKRATGYSYYPIVASGKSACVLHYVENNQVCNDGDLLLLDFGAEYANYAGDLTRTIPVNGKFTPRQKDCYEAVLRTMKSAINLLRPGTTIDEYHKAVCKLMEQELVGLGLLKQEDIDKQDPKKPAYMKYYMHGTSHYMGLDVHDLGFKQEVLKAGMAFSCEPGIYIPEESIGIRIENDIIVTDGDPLDLMASIPKEVDEIEALMS
jgi:Xaa-Pro aminopeptidase